MKTPANANRPLLSTALILIVQVVLLTVPFFVLQTSFDFPEILRKPADVALRLLAQNHDSIVPAYYVFTLTGVITVAIASLVRDVLMDDERRSWLNVTTAFGVSAGLMQVLGFIRWPFMMSFMAQTYVDGATTQATRESIAMIYEAFNRWAGASVGEHLGFLFQGLWLVLVSVTILRSARMPRWLGIVGVLFGIGILISIAETFGGPLAPLLATINVVANIGLTVWLLLLAIVLLGARRTGLREPARLPA